MGTTCTGTRWEYVFQNIIRTKSHPVAGSYRELQGRKGKITPYKLNAVSIIPQCSFSLLHSVVHPRCRSFHSATSLSFIPQCSITLLHSAVLLYLQKILHENYSFSPRRQKYNSLQWHRMNQLLGLL